MKYTPYVLESETNLPIPLPEGGEIEGVTYTGELQLLNDDPQNAHAGEAFYISGENKAKKAIATSVETSSRLVFPIGPIPTGTVGTFVRFGIIKKEGSDLIPTARYFLSALDAGKLIANDGPPVPSLTVEVGFAANAQDLVIDL